MFKHILIPLDGTKLSQTAVDEGLKLAKSINARVTGFIAEPEYELPHYGEVVSRTAVSVDEHERRARAHAEQLLEMVAGKAKQAGVEFQGKFSEADRPHLAIINAAREYECDLVVMASHGRHGVSAVIFGSETHEVMAHSKIPVLVYR